MKKTVFFVLAFLCMAGTLTAQDHAGCAAYKADPAAVKQVVDSLTIKDAKMVQWVDSVKVYKGTDKLAFNKFWDNWFITIGGGVQMYTGDFDDNASIGDRLTPMFEISAGKWFHPLFGARLQVNGGQLKGYTLSSTNGLNTDAALYDGQYYTQEWNQIFAHADVMFDVTNLFWGYRPNRFYSFIPYAGAGGGIGLEDNKSKTIMLVGGIINRFRLSNRFDLNLEIKRTLVEEDNDYENVGKVAEGFGALTLGLTWKFGQNGSKPFEAAKATNTYITRYYKPEFSKQVLGQAQEIVKANDARVASYAKAKGITVEQARAELAREDARLAEEARKKGVTVEQVRAEKAVEAKAQVVEKMMKPSQKVAIFFDFDKSAVSERGKLNLSYVAEVMKKYSDLKVRLVATADNNKTSKPAYNEKLSQRRAESVRDILVKVYGIDESRLTIEALGGVNDHSPLYLNRAVTIVPVE